MNKALRYLSIVMAVLALAALACGDNQSGEKVGETGGEESAPAELKTYGVGEVIQVKDHTIVLNEASVTTGRLHANWTIENKGSEEETVSSLLSFTAKDEEGSKLEMDIFDCGTSSLDGTVLAGDKLKGSICWKGATKGPFKLYYEASLLGSGAVVWEVK